MHYFTLDESASVVGCTKQLEQFSRSNINFIKILPEKIERNTKIDQTSKVATYFVLLKFKH